VIRALNRDELQRYLFEQNIATGLHYPIPVHLQPAFQNLGYRQGDLPITEQCALEVLSLPMFPQLQPEQQVRVAETISTFVKETAVSRGASPILT
jgi:dTDP-4-amino-4,6-dideoxygalactose transaminase